jgi:1,4-dihydroxy-2-naphthoate octaprenyltransferase
LVLDKFIRIVKLGRLIAHTVILVYVLGALFAVVVGASFDVVKFTIGYIILFSGVLAAIYTNNYNDVAIDRYATHTFFSGGSSILIDHPELMKTTRHVATALYSVSILLGFVCMVVFSYPITFFLYVLLGNFLGWCYTSPPVKLVYRGFGEFTTMIGAGFIIPGLAYFLMRGTIDAPFVLFSVPLMLFGFTISLYLELPDKNADSTGQKRTFVVRRGERLGLLLGLISTCLVIFCFVLFALFPILTVALNFWLIALFSMLPVIVGVWSLMKYHADSTKILPIVFRAVTCVFIVYILLDIYFIYVILT